MRRVLAVLAFFPRSVLLTVSIWVWTFSRVFAEISNGLDKIEKRLADATAPKTDRVVGSVSLPANISFELISPGQPPSTRDDCPCADCTARRAKTAAAAKGPN